MLRCANVLGPDVDTGFTRMFALPLVPMVLGFDPRLQFVHEDDVVHALEHAALQPDPGRLQRRRRRRPGALGGDRPARQAAAAGAAAVRHRPAGGAAAPARLPDPRRDGQPAALRPRRRQPPATRRPASTTATPRARPCSSSASTCGCEPVLRGRRRGLPLRARGRGVPALEPARAPRARRGERRASRPIASRSGSELPIASADAVTAVCEKSAGLALHSSELVGRQAPDSGRLPGRGHAPGARSAPTRGTPRAPTRSPRA